MLQISSNDYFEHPAVSRSDLLASDKGLKYFRYYKENGTKETEAMIFGRAFHKMILEPEDFHKEYLITEERISNKIKEEAGEREILKHDNFTKILGMKDAILSNSVIQDYKILEGIDAEKTYIAKIDDIECKIRPDFTKFNKTLTMGDIKTTCNLDNFEYEIFDRLYHMQAAFYMDVYEQAIGGRVARFLIIAVEKEPPYLNKVFWIDYDSDILKYGRAEYKRLIEIYKKYSQEEYTEKDEVKLLKEIPYKYRLRTENLGFNN